MVLQRIVSRSLALSIIALAALAGCSGEASEDDTEASSEDALKSRKGQTCGGIVGAECRSNLVCEMPPGSSAGTCVSAPKVGTLGGKCRSIAPTSTDCDPGLHCLIKIQWPTTPNGTPVTTRTCIANAVANVDAGADANADF